jgi:hypothetical protein
MTSTTRQEQQGTLEVQQNKKDAGPVECLGLTFENDKARREHFLALLKEKLQDPEFRKTPGFPQGSDEAILRMSDPPYYTACPNPFLEEFVKCYGKPYDPDEAYEREPFAVDVSVGKTDQLYKAHGYHTKVPHLAIVPSILHYTKPGDIVLDGFCGSGMTGLAAQWCGIADKEYRSEITEQCVQQGNQKPEWGQRHAILNDIGPAATFIASGYNIPFAAAKFKREASRILAELSLEIGWMYEARHGNTDLHGSLNYTVWSEVLSCPECGGEIVFAEQAIDRESGTTIPNFACPSCSSLVGKRNLEKVMETRIDPFSKKPWRRIKLKPIFLNYSLAGRNYTRDLTEEDQDIINRVEEIELPEDFPGIDFPLDRMYHGSRLGPKGVHSVHHIYTKRSALSLWAFWQKAQSIEDPSIRRAMIWSFESSIPGMSIMNRHHVFNRCNVNQQLNGVYYIPSIHEETSLFRNIAGKLSRVAAAFEGLSERRCSSLIANGDCGCLPIPGSTVDYVFTDPPFGENIFYADLNFLTESWHGVFTSSAKEAIVDKFKDKDIAAYQQLMKNAFAEYHRVLKPGRWMTIVFSNSKNSIWRAIQEAIGAAGFVIADVRTLDKKQGSYRQVTSSAVKQDLVISAYKPTEALQRKFQIRSSSSDGAWAFVREHLRHVPVFVGRSNDAEIVAERTPQMLLDRMIAFHVQHGISVPLSGPEFLQGLAQRFPERDGMYFLSDQVTEYDRKRTTATQLRQLSFFVNDEHSAIQWIRQQLQDKPQSFQDLQPQFMRELQAWAKHEQTVELKVILEQNFLHYDGRGPVPSQIHSYLSSNFKDLRNLDKEDPRLIEKARDRWYVPDPNKQADLDQIRERALLKEFEELKESTQRRIKQFRTEAVRAGFKACWQEKDYATIVKVAAKLPEAVLQEDEKLLMYIDNAQTRLGDDA